MKSSSQYILVVTTALAVWALTPPASAQTRPSLGLKLSAGKATLSLTGDVGAIYSIESANDLSPTNHWTDRTLLQVQGTAAIWTDPSLPTTRARFYRAVSIPAPSDTNLVFVQPGTFTMGSPRSEALRQSEGQDETQHGVTISRGFWMEKYPVTQGQYLAVVGSNPSYYSASNGYPDDLTRPAEQVRWVDATNYCAMRTAQDQAAGMIPTNYLYRLPTESEWEYTRRAGTTTAFYLGSALHSGEANFNGHLEYDAALGEITNSSGIWLEMTTPVGSYAANGWGFYDMIGNVFEWCLDWFGTYPRGDVTDPKGPVTGDDRVLRGGCYYGNGYICRAAERRALRPTDSAPNCVGFRIVLARQE